MARKDLDSSDNDANIIERIYGAALDFGYNFYSYRDRFTLVFRRFSFTQKKQLAFLEDFNALLSDGIPANRAIEMMAQASTGVLREVSLSIANKVSEGQPIAEGMREWFKPAVVEIVRVGEEGGVLAETIKSAANTLKMSSGSFSTFIGAITYPLVVIIIASAVIVYLDNSVFPQFELIKPISQWPQAGKDLIEIAHIIQSWWWLILLSVVAIILFFKRLMANYVGDFRSVLDSFPPFNYYRRFVAARFMETLGLLVANGLVFKHALKVLQNEATPYLSSHLIIMEHKLATGASNVADVLDTGLIDTNSILRLRIMAEVKGIEHGLIRLGVAATKETNDTLRVISRIIGGMLLAIGAALILLIIRGIYLTGMSMSS